MSVYREFTGKTVEEALHSARDEFGVGLDDLDFEILTPGSRGVLGMGAEPARIVAAPRSALGGTAPKREAAASVPLPPPPPREERPRFGDRERPGRERGGWREERGERPAGERPGRERGQRFGDRGPVRPSGPPREEPARPAAAPAPAARPGPRPVRRDEAPRRRGESDLTASEVAQVAAARETALGGSHRTDEEPAEASPEALETAREILEELMQHLGFEVRVEVETGETNRLNVVGEGGGREALGALIGRKGERLSALQHLVNLMLSRRVGTWTRVLVDVEDYRGRRERQLRDLADRAARRVVETGKMLQLEPMPALERRWIHLALRDHPEVATQSIGEEPNRRIVVLPRSV